MLPLEIYERNSVFQARLRTMVRLVFDACTVRGALVVCPPSSAIVHSLWNRGPYEWGKGKNYGDPPAAEKLKSIAVCTRKLFFLKKKELPF